VTRCYITDRSLLPDTPALLAAIARNLAAGVEWIQIREKDLPARDLYGLVQTAMALSRPPSSKIIVNTRIDVALAAGAHGVHLPASSPSPRAWRPIVPPDFLIGVSCHTLDDLKQAEEEGANYAVFGPVFAPLSKSTDLTPVGLDGLSAAVDSVRMRVLALGGITKQNAASCLEVGAAGIAGITLFQG